MQTITHSSQLPNIVLGSSSPFRRSLLEKLNLSFSQFSPEIDETPLDHETPREMVARLTRLKAQAVVQRFPESLVIASDQSACFDNRPIGKPHNHENAVKQLQQFSGHAVTFYTGLALYDPRTRRIHEALDTTEVHFRSLEADTIERYLRAEQPYQCAGSFKSEGLGITLFDRIQSRDPNALIGLPLIELTSLFRKLGVILPLAD